MAKGRSARCSICHTMGHDKSQHSKFKVQQELAFPQPQRRVILNPDVWETTFEVGGFMFHIKKIK